MSSESRLVILVLVGLGLFASCCLCVPVGVAIALPAIARVQKAAEEVRAKQRAEQQALEQAARQQARRTSPFPPAVPPPVLFPPLADRLDRSAPPEISLIPSEPPPRVIRPERPAVEPRKVPRRSPASALQGNNGMRGGMEGLSEPQRRVIYRSATIQGRMKDSMQRQITERRQRGLDTSTLERMMRDRDARQEQDLERLCETFKITRQELQQIIKEGKEKSW